MSSQPNTTASKAHRIVIVEDHPLMREGIAKWIEQDPTLEVCGEASTAPEGIQAVEELKPDLLLCDITLGDRSGLELIKDLHALDPDLPVIMLSMHDESIYALRAVRAGARGFVMKKAGGAEVVAAIKEVLAGGTVFSRRVTAQLMAEYSGRKRGHKAPLAALTDREFEVFQLLAKGGTSREIARQMGIGLKTLGTHRMNICRKLNLTSTPDLIRFAIHYFETGKGT